MALTKANIIQNINQQLEFPQKKSTELVEQLIETIKSTLASDEDVLVSGFGKFSVNEKKERRGRNPATGDSMILKPRRVVTFKCSGKLRRKVNSGAIIYAGELFSDHKISRKLQEHISQKNKLIVLKHGAPPYKVIIGVPHHSSIGQNHICEEKNTREGDENAASYALVAFSALKEKNYSCKLVIMAHSTTLDPNKELDSPYCREIFAEHTELLFECHGSGPNRENELELTAGKNDLSKSTGFGELLFTELNQRYNVAVQKKAGTDGALIFRTDGKRIEGKLKLPANQTPSLVEARDKGIPALHIEAKPKFRIPKNKKNTLSDDGLILGVALGEAIIQYNL